MLIYINISVVYGAVNIMADSNKDIVINGMLLESLYKKKSGYIGNLVVTKKDVTHTAFFSKNNDGSWFIHYKSVFIRDINSINLPKLDEIIKESNKFKLGNLFYIALLIVVFLLVLWAFADEYILWRFSIPKDWK